MSISTSPELEKQSRLGWFMGVVAGVIITLVGMEGFDGQGYLPAGISLIAVGLGPLVTGAAFSKMVGWA